MAVGDVNSTERGSGARYNDGKPDWSLLPLWTLFPLEIAGRRSAYPSPMALLGHYQRYGDASVLWDAVNRLYENDDPWKAYEEAAQVFSYGAKKYAAWNWAKGMKWSVPLACAARHIVAILRGEHADPESGLPHRAHVVCNVMMLVQFQCEYPEGNDLPWSENPDV